ncbi:MAG: flagellar assembly protein FliW [Firmicutes bacterium]|nr:flagellar assembly protein FliW [Bacillota bacterium]
MKLSTPHFGTIPIEKNGIITFPKGIPGFEDCHRFVLLQRPHEAPLAWLQGVDMPQLALAVAQPTRFLTSYNPHFPPEELAPLDLEVKDAALIYIILVLSPELEKITANLQAPIVINREKKLGVQAFLGDQWPRKYHLFPPMGRKKAVNK